MAQHWTNSATTTLNGAITSGATSLAVNTGDGALFPSSFPFRMRIDNEIIEVGARSTDTLSSLTRGVESTTAASHSSGAAVKGVLTAGQIAMFHQTGVAELTVSDMANGGLFQIGSIAATGSSGTITFSSIPGGYNALRLLYTARSDSAVVAASTFMRLNSDSGNNYDVIYSNSNGTTPTVTTFIAQAQGFLGYIAGASCPAGVADSGEIVIPTYAGTTFQKTYRANTQLNEGPSTDLQKWEVAGWYRSTSAITTLSLTTVGNFVSGSVFLLYGMV